jgi:hypothetical protein
MGARMAEPAAPRDGRSPDGGAAARLSERLGSIAEAVAALLRWDPEMRIAADELQRKTEKWGFMAPGEKLKS